MVTLGEPDAHANYFSISGNVVRAKWRPYLTCKRWTDVIVSLALASFVFLPLFVIVAPILLLDGGPIFYAQRRIGARGRRFDCYKFRSMRPDADRILAEIFSRDSAAKIEWEQNHKLGQDPRITGIGRFLRRFSLDELPQIWNVLKGDMSLVGPRPIVDDEVAHYGRRIGSYLSRRPGLTGFWQVRGRNIVEYRRRVAMDVWYARNASFVLDLTLLAETVGVVLCGKGTGTRGKRPLKARGSFRSSRA